MRVIEFNEIARTVTAFLTPYGINRTKDKYHRNFLSFVDDNGWFVIIIDFSKNEYMQYDYFSISIDFNWYLEDSFFNTIGYSDEFKNYENTNKTYEKIISKVLEYRNYMKNIKTAEKYILKCRINGCSNVWKNYHRGIISGLAGNIENLNKHFDKVLAASIKNNQWRIELKERTLELRNTANKDLREFVRKVVNIINKTRELKKLDKMEIIIE